MGIVFFKLNCTPRWRERLPTIEIPALVFHEIPGSRLLVLKEAATAIPDAATGEVAEAMLALG